MSFENTSAGIEATLRFAFAVLLQPDESLLKEAGRWDSEEESDWEDKEEVDDEDEEEGAEEIVEETCVKLPGFSWAAAKEHSPSRGLRHQIFVN